MNSKKNKVNKFKEHLVVIPEDPVNREIVNGFLLHSEVDERALRILPPHRDKKKGGWKRVIKRFKTLHNSMRELKYRYVLLLIDFDKNKERFNRIRNKIPNELEARVFIMGTFSEPEELKKTINKNFKNFEEIGGALAEGCANDNYCLWQHDLLKHNSSELDRMIGSVKPFLFIEKQKR